MNLPEKAFHLIELPFQIATLLTVFPTNMMNYHKGRCLVNALLSPAFILWVVGSWFSQALLMSLVGLGIGLGLAIGSFVVLKADRFPSKAIDASITAFGAVGSCAWLFWISENLAGLAAFLKNAHGVSEGLLGLSIVAAGLAVPYYNIQVARAKKSGELPTFWLLATQLLFNFGVALLIRSLTEGPAAASMWPHS